MRCTASRVSGFVQRRVANDKMQKSREVLYENSIDHCG